MTALLRKLAGFYIASLVVLVWSAVCICIGAGWALLALTFYLKARGVL
jgi:hypothetical protein